MLKTLNMALVCCPVGFSEEIIAVFPPKKSQFDTKNSKIFHFPKFLRIFCQIFDRLRGLECFKGSTRQGLVVQLSFLKSILPFLK